LSSLYVKEPFFFYNFSVYSRYIIEKWVFDTKYNTWQFTLINILIIKKVNFCIYKESERLKNKIIDVKCG